MDGIPLIPFLISFLSGLASFLHESVWIRAFGFVLGNSSASATLVLSAFVAGLGLGGLILPSKFRDPRRGYVLLQMAAGILGAILPFFVLRTEIWPGGASDFLFAFVAVFVPAFFIGGSFPLLFAFCSSSLTRREAAWLYGLNTAGAMIGAAAGPYLGAVWLGLQGTGWAAGAINFANVALTLLAWRSLGARSAIPADHGNARADRFAVQALFVAGFVTMGFEILLARVLMFYFKGYAIVYAAVIAVFLLGLSLGNFSVARRDPAKSSSRALGVGLLLAGIGCVLPLAISKPVGEYSGFWSTGESFFFYSRLIGIAALFALPATLALGACIPLAFEALGGSADRRAGKAAFWNCLGSLVSPLLLGLWLIQAVSLPVSFVLVALPAVVLGFSLLWRDRTQASRLLSLGAVIPAALLFAPGVFDDFLQKSWIVKSSPHIDILAHRDGRDFGVSVVEDRLQGERTLLTDSFRAAGTHEDFRYMHGLGSLPLLVHPKPEKVCVICFGTGTTAGAVARHGEVRELDIVEIAQEAIDFAPWFTDRNRDLFPNGVLDSRARFIVDDGRRFLRETDRSYDVITLEPLLPVTPVAVHFYTKEFYDLVKRRLRPGGVICQWVPTAVVYPQAYRSLLAAFFDSFPQGTLWALGEVTVLLGGGPPVEEFARGAWRQRGDLPTILSRMGFSDPEQLLASLLARGEDLRKSFEGEPILIDDRPWVEWFGHQSNKDRFVMASHNLQFLASLQEGVSPFWVSTSARERKFRYLEARLSAANENLFLEQGIPFPARATLDRLETIVREGGPPEAQRWRSRVAGVVGFREGIAAMQQGQPAKAGELFQWAVREDPGNCRPWIGLGAAQLLLGKEREARESLAKGFVLFPRLREGVDWRMFSTLLGDLAHAEVVSAAEALGRKADDLLLALQPSWETFANMAKGDRPEQSLALWAASLRLPFEFQRILEERLREGFLKSEDSVFASIAELWKDEAFLQRAGAVWKFSPQVHRRETACFFFGELSGKNGLADLIDLLNDADLSVRRAAIAALFRRTKQSLDYDFAAEPRLRELAIKRWLTWLDRQ